MKNKSFRLFSLLITAGILSSCNNNGNNTASSDSTSSTTTTTTTSNNYSARADSITRNSQAGNYLNPRTGRPLHLRMDTTNGSITDESGAPVRRYVDKRTWWVYDATSGDTIGSAQLNNGNLMYRGSNGDWVPYDKRWTDDTTSTVTNTPNASDSGMNNTSGSENENGSNASHKHTKIKIKDHGDKVKTVEKTKD